MIKTIILEPPKPFPLKLLRKILQICRKKGHNPLYSVLMSPAFYKMLGGAKGLGKSFAIGLNTIYRFVNEIIFCSCWTRNQYSHILTTLKPMFERILDWLANKWNLDYRQHIAVYNSGLYWLYDDGGQGRAIYFENWEKIQSFQGFTLKKMNFRFGELVIDDPIEDKAKWKKSPTELLHLYQLQYDSLPLLIQSTLLRDPAPKKFKQNLIVSYNIFDSNHFFIQKYHNKIIEVVKSSGKINQDNLNKLLNETYLEKTDMDFDNQLGITVAQFTKYYLKQNMVSEKQWQALDSLKQTNLRLWTITVAGYPFAEENKTTGYFLKPYILNDEGKIHQSIKFIDWQKFKNKLINNEILGIFDGFDPGKTDKASWSRIALTNKGEIIYLKIIEDIRKLIKNNSRLLVKKALIHLILRENKKIETILDGFYLQNSFFKSYTSMLFLDNDIIYEDLKQDFKAMNARVKVKLAVRRDGLSRVTKLKEKFGIINRQEWQKFIFNHNLICFMSGTKKVLSHLIKQYIHDGEVKRDETIHREIYDVINSFEYAASIAYRKQLILRGKKYESMTKI